MPTPTKHINKKGFKKATSTKIWKVDIRNCRPAPELEREIYEDLEGTTELIRQYGILQPLWGKRDPENPEKFIIYDGKTRILASQPLIAEGKVVTATIRIIPPGMTLEEMYELQIILNRGKRYEDFENAKVVKNLVEKYNRTPIEIQKKYSWTPQYVESLIIFNEAPQFIHELVRQGRLSLTFLMELYKKEEKDFGKVEEILRLADKEVEKPAPEVPSLFASVNTDDCPIEEETSEDETEDDDEDDFEVPVEEQRDELFDRAAKFVIETQIATPKHLQDEFEISYSRAGVILSQLQNAGIVSAFTGGKDRQVLITRIEEWEKKNVHPAERLTEVEKEAPVAWQDPRDLEPPPPKKKGREKSQRITQKHVDKALKKVNSFSELWKFMKENESLKVELSVAGSTLWTFAEGLRDNKFTAADFPKMFFGEKAE